MPTSALSASPSTLPLLLCAVAYSQLSAGSAFVSPAPFAVHTPACKAALLAPPSLRHAAVNLRMGYLDDIQTASGKDADGNQIMPTSYEGFIDGEGFDGGDGQVGVVGDGSNAMETFDNRAVDTSTMGGSNRGKVAGGSSGNRIDKRWNAWGSDAPDITEELKAQGMVDIDIFTGEDKKEVQRQQMQNWFAQRAVWAKESAQRQEIESFEGRQRQKNTGDYFDILNSGVKSDQQMMSDKDKENVIFATGARGIDNTELLKKTDWPPVSEGKRIDGTFEVRGNSMVTIAVEPNSMVALDYIARFTADTPPGHFVVAAFLEKTGYDIGGEEITGLLPRRGKPVDFYVRFDPKGPLSAPLTGTLVLETEDWKWTYKIIGSS